MSKYNGYRGPTRPDDNYPYPPAKYNTASNPSLNPMSTTKLADDRFISRTPSPTPSELEALKTGALDWKRLAEWRFWLRKEWTWYYVAFIIIAALTILLTVFHTQIVHWLTPVATWLHGLKFGWLVPIAILFVISFPPLFGHEIVAVLCGLVWGLGIGFGIVAAGTFFGEVGNFYAFKYCCRARAEKLEKTKLGYACLAKVIRDGGFPIALVARLSLIPGHFTTALFSTCGMGIITFCLAAIFSSPKQFITVYLGVILEQSASQTTTTTKGRIISDAVVAGTAIVTALAMWWILRKMNEAKPLVIYERRKARQLKLARGHFSPYANSDATASTVVGFSPRDSDSEIPLNFGDGSMYHQQWDKEGRAVGYAPDPQLYAPQPKRVGGTHVAGRTPIQQSGDSGGHDYSRGVQYGRSPVQQSSDDSHDDPELHEEYVISPPGIPSPRNQLLSEGPKFSPYPHTAPSGLQKGPVQQPRSYSGHDVMQTPTQAQFVGSASVDVTSPSFPPLPSPNFARTGHPQAPSASNYYVHAEEASSDSFHTAYGGHSRPATDATIPSERAFSPQHRGNMA